MDIEQLLQKGEQSQYIESYSEIIKYTIILLSTSG